MRAARWVAVAAVVLFVAGCGSTAHYPPLQLTVKDDNRLMSAKPGQTIVITLPVSGGTGYHWEYVGSAGSDDDGTVAFVTQSHVPPAQGRPGAAGEAVFRFRAAHSSSHLADLFFYLFPPTSHVHPKRVFQATLRVR